MTIREYRPSDAPSMKRIAEASGFPYVDPGSKLVESCLVVTDETGDVVAAVAAHRILELYLWKDSRLSPAASLSILRAMHNQMGLKLRDLGYTEANIFIPPTICGRFGRRLRKTFGWVSNWPSLAIRF